MMRTCFIWVLMLKASAFICVEGSGAGDASCPTYIDTDTGLDKATCWRLSASHCVCIMNAICNKDYYTTSGFCSELDDSGLVSLHSKQENSILHDKIRNLTVDTWIGLQYEPPSPNHQAPKGSAFKWDDGTPTNYFNWIGGTPSSQYMMCTKMRRDTGAWEIVDAFDEPFPAASCGVKSELPPTTPGPSHQPPGKNSAGVVVGVLLGSVLVLLGALTVAVLAIRRRRTNRQEEGSRLLTVSEQLQTEVKSYHGIYNNAHI